MTMVERLLEIAITLAREGARSSVATRRAVSTAYYALFHALARLCANTLVEPQALGTPEYERVYRALDHGTMKNAFGIDTLKGNQLIARIGKAAIDLQGERHKSDYLPPANRLYTTSQCEELIERAKAAVEDISALTPQESRLLATCLLFRDRRQ